MSKSHNFICGWQSIKRQEKYTALNQPVCTPQAEGAYVYDADGKKYIDFLMGWGSIITEHGDPDIVQLIQKEAQTGLQLNGHSLHEINFAEKLRAIHDQPVKIGYFANGSDAVTAGVRIARSYTGKDHVIFTGYHGWNEWAQPNANGLHSQVPSLSQKIKPFEKDKLIAAIKKHGSQLACIVLEIPLRGNDSMSLVQDIHELSKKYGFCIIFDEIKSCPRLGFNYGVQQYGIYPDMIAYGKAIGGGLPFSALLIDERFDSASEDVHLSATCWGNPLGIAVASYITDLFLKTDTRECLKRQADLFVSEFNALSKKFGKTLRLDEYTVLPNLLHSETEGFMDAFYTSTFQNGLFLRPNHCWFLSLAHTKEVIEDALQRYEKALYGLTQ